ncbi:MAG: hypothetical protein KAR05_08895 [Candidatus Omnitrophica bacterium]|nr:hypothetical protein [Candidatus Omnitrophota bacterium]
MADYICPQCGNSIYDEEALLCHFCGESLQRAGDGLLSKFKYKQSNLIIPLIALITVLALILLFIF